MKQNLLAARSRETVLILALCNLALVVSSCGNLPRHSSAGGPSFAATVGLEADARGHGTGSLPVIVNINTAAASDLEKLPGVGKVLAARIIEHRAQYGPFRRPEHLLMVRGISDHKFREIREMLTVDQ